MDLTGGMLNMSVHFLACDLGAWGILSILSFVETERSIEYSSYEVTLASSCEYPLSHVGMHWDLWVLHMNVVGGTCSYINTAAFCLRV